MNILIVMELRFPDRSATASRIRKFALGLREAGAEACVVSIWNRPNQPGAEGGWQVDDSGVPYILASRPARSFGSMGRAMRHLQLRWHISRKVREVVEEKARQGHPIDAAVMYGTNWNVWQPVVSFCRKRGIATLIDCIEWHPLALRPASLLFSLDWWLCRNRLFPKLSGIIAISRFWEEYAVARGIPAIRIPAMGEGVDGRESPPPAPRAGQFTVTYMGLLLSRDLPPTLLEGLRRAAIRGTDIRLVVVGRVSESSSGRLAVRAVERDAILRERVVFTGWVSDQEVERHLAQADALVLLRPQTRETKACFPTRLPEYLSTGRPVILSAAGDMPLYFQHRRNAWLLPPGDRPEELAEAFVHLHAHPDEAHDIGRAGRETGASEFCYRQHGRRLLTFLEQITCGRPQFTGDVGASNGIHERARVCRD